MPTGCRFARRRARTTTRALEPPRARGLACAPAAPAPRSSRTSSAQTRQLKAEVETALWELVAAGLVTADGFDNLRALIDPQRRAGQGHGKHARPRHSAGRWSLLYAALNARRDAASDTRSRDERTRAIEATCWMLLRRYGVVFRELLARETLTAVVARAADRVPPA